MIKKIKQWWANSR